MMPILNEPAPELHVSQWVQGEPLSLHELRGKVVLVEVFQVNCPGCFLFGLPEAVRLHDMYAHKGLVVIGLATAFDDYENNTLDNLRALVDSGAVIGAAKEALEVRDELVSGKFRWQLPFSVGMDVVVPDDAPVDDAKVHEYANRLYPDFQLRRQEEQGYLLKMTERYLQMKTMKAETFELYNLKGTPSTILVDREGLLRDISFGQSDTIENLILQYLG